nr:DMT family transporter [uncultured Vibrio sp.]
MKKILRHKRNTLIFSIIPWLFVFLWSTGFIAAKYTIAFSEPFYLLFLRGILSCISFALLALLFKARWPSVQSALGQMHVGIYLQVLFLGGCFKAIELGMPASFVAIITGLQPIMTAIYLSQREDITFSKTKWIGISLGFIGVVLVLYPFDSNSDVTFPMYAIVASLVGLIGITTGSLVQKTQSHNSHILTQVFYQYVSLTLVMGLLSFVFETQDITWTLSFTLGLLWLVLGVSVTAILLLMFMIRNGESTKVATYFYLVPVFAAIESWLIFDQSISLFGMTGMLITILGLIMVIKNR